MCTSVIYKNRYFGRNLDYEFSYGEKIAITPRNFSFHFRNGEILNEHFAIIGMAHISDNYPLYYDAINEKGLGIAGLNFVGNAYYNEIKEGYNNIASFELIPYLLSKCESVEDVKDELKLINISNENFSSQLPSSELHWMIADKKSCIVVESLKDGLKVHENLTQVLTNNPPFDKQLFNLNNYYYLSSKAHENTFSSKLTLDRYSRGMGAIGLPGDLSSASRFVRASFTCLNVKNADNKDEDINQFFHILGSVEQQKGLCELVNGKYEYTIYSSCCDLTETVYYYKTYDSYQIKGLKLFNENLNSKDIISYDLISEENIYMQN